MPASGRPWNTLRARLKARWRAEERTCVHCHQAIDYDAAPGVRNSFTVDHITPTNLGGDPLREANCQPACWHCNSARGDGTRRGSFNVGTTPSRAW